MIHNAIMIIKYFIIILSEKKYAIQELEVNAMKRKTPKIKDPFMFMHELPENWIKVVKRDFMNSGMLFSKSSNEIS